MDHRSPRPAAPRRAASALVAAVALAFAGLATVTCGPSELARAYDPFRSAVEPRLEAEHRLWAQVAEASAEQGDARGDAAYRAFLETKARPYYAELRTALEALRPGHARLDPARDALVAFAKARGEFVELELARLDLARDTAGLAEIQRAQDAMNEAQQAYQDLVADDVPDNRYGDVNACVKEFVSRTFEKAVAGAIEPEEAVAVLRRDVLPRSRALRDGRFDDTPHGRAFRKFVVTADDFLNRMADGLPTLVGVLRAKQRVEAVTAEAADQQRTFQRIFFEAQRDR